MTGKNPTAQRVIPQVDLGADLSLYLSFLGEVDDAGKVVGDGGDVVNIFLILGQF